MSSYKWGYKSPNMGYNYSYPIYNPNLELPMNLQVEEAKLAISQESVESVMSTRFLTSALEALILQAKCWFGPLG